MQGVFAAATEELESVAAVLDYGLALGTGCMDSQLLDLHSESSWRDDFVWQVRLRSLEDQAYGVRACKLLQQR